MALTLIITNAGRAALVAAQAGGTNAVRIASVGVTATTIAATTATAALPDEIKRVATIAGTGIAADAIHLVVRDETAAAYTMRSFALYLADGTLFAAYGQADPIIAKTASSLMLLALDVKFADIAAAQIQFGDAGFLNPPATTDIVGVVELATIDEARAGLDALRALTPAAAKAAVPAWIGYTPANKAGEAFDGDVSARNLFVTTGDLHIARTTTWGYVVRPSAVGYRNLGFTTEGGAAPLDRVDFSALSVTRSGATMWDAGNDGAGSGLDADMLDGQHGSWYADAAGRLGFTPVRQGGGAGQLAGNVIQIGWSGVRLKAQVDNIDQGNFVFDNHIADVWRASNDGAGSGLDADTVRGALPVFCGGGVGQVPIGANVVKIGWSGSRLKATIDVSDLGNLVFDGHVADVWRASNDGAGSGMDADLLDGRDGAWYADAVSRLGYTPVRQGGGAGQLANVIQIGWSGSRLKAQTDAIDLGNVVFDGHVADVWRASNDGAGSGLDADMLDGHDASEFVFRTDGTTFGSNGNGYWEKRPNGVIEQWGTAAVPSGANTASIIVKFPIAFTDAASIVVSGQSVNGANANWATLSLINPELSKTSATLAADSTDVSQKIASGRTVRWRAIGR